jgi:hypothetical protein
MKKKVILKRIFHCDKWRIALIFDYDEKLKTLIRPINGFAFSGTNKCFYVDDSEENLKLILITLKDAADVDISHIVNKEELSDPVQVKSDITNAVFSQPDTEISDEDDFEVKPQPRTILEISGDKGQNVIGKEYHDHRNVGPVEFRISEEEGIHRRVYIVCLRTPY